MPLSDSQLQALPPLICRQTAVLILGSFPGAASLRAQQYYAHPQNHFWPILAAIWPDSPINTSDNSYQNRSNWLLSRRLGVWDVYAACEREGSLDSSIRKPVLNDFSALERLCPELRAIAHNGGESFKHARHTRLLGLPVLRLPSTSAANASWRFERKLAAWRSVFEEYGLI